MNIPNEVLLILSVLVLYGLTIAAFAFFGEHGLMAWSVVATIAANIEALVLVNAFGMSMTLGNVLFASTFLVTDILSELYGKKAANRTVNIGIFVSICFILISQSWFLYTPSAEDFVSESLYNVFSNTPRIMTASLVVYAIVQRFDVWLYHAIWKLTEKRLGTSRGWLFLRNNGSTLTSQLLNAVLFTFIAFYGVYSLNAILSIIVSSYVIFLFTSLLDTPFIYLARHIHEKRAKISQPDGSE